VVDLKKDEDFRTLGVELLSIAPDPAIAWRADGRELGIRDFDTVLTDAENEVATSQGVMRWAVGGGPVTRSPSLTGLERSRGSWTSAASRTAASCTSSPHEIVRQVRDHL